MKSVKPGRGPSFMGGIAGLVGVVFSIGWTATAIAMGAPLVFPIFGVCFTGLTVAITIYNFKNAKSRNRYSAFDIVDGREEPDPLNEKYGATTDRETPADGEGAHFCPYCGAPVEDDHVYCKQCGKRLS